MKLTVNEFRYRDDNPPPRLLVTPIVPLLLLLLLFIFLFFLLFLLLRIMTSIRTFISYLRGPRLASFAWCRRRRPRLEFTRVNGQKSFDRARNRGMQRFLNVLGDDDVGER